MVIYLARRLRAYPDALLRGDCLKEMGEVFGIGGYSTVSSAVQRVKAGMEKDELLRKRVYNLIAIFSKSQQQTPNPTIHSLTSAASKRR